MIAFWIIFLLVLGLVMLTCETIAPGFDFGILGILGVAALVASSVLIILHVDFGVYIVAGKVLVIGLGMFAIVRYWRDRKINKMILQESLAQDESALKEPEFLAKLDGKSGRTKTALRPHGLADFSGEGITDDIEVRSVEGYIPNGEIVTVTHVKERVVFVRKG